MGATEPSVWLLIGPRDGDNNQALALGEALGVPFAVKTLAYNWLQRFSLRLPPTLVSLTSAARAGIRPPWPKVVIAVGRRSIPIARWIRMKSGGRAKIVRIGHPRKQADLFDLIITTRQYPLPEGENVVLLPVTMSRFVPPPPPTPDEQAWIDALPRPIRLVAVGGPTKYWQLRADPILRSVAVDSGCAVVVTSRRTPAELVRKLCEARRALRLVEDGFPSFGALLGAADEIHVTGDSLSMLSEAIQAGKPVMIIPIERDSKGKKKLGDTPRTSGPGAGRRDLRRFWAHLIDEGFAGTPETGARRAPRLPKPAETAAAAVRKLLGRD